MKIREMGFVVSDEVNEKTEVSKNDFGNYEFVLADTKWEYDPISRRTRHGGFGPGCFWTDWEE